MVVRLRALRLQQPMSVKELAKHAGVTPQTVANVEHGRQVPRYESMRKIAGALGVGPNEIDEFKAAIAYWAHWEVGQRKTSILSDTDSDGSSIAT